MRERTCVHEGTCYPTNHVIAAFESRSEAEAAEAVLRAAGFPDVDLFHGHEAYATILEATRHQPPIARLWRRLRNLGGDEGELHERYLMTLRRGGSYLIVYAASAEHTSRVRDLLASHHAHDIWHLGGWVLERLPDGQIAPVRT